MYPLNARAGVVGVREIGELVLQVTLVPEQQSIQAFTANGIDKALDEKVGKQNYVSTTSKCLLRNGTSA